MSPGVYERKKGLKMRESTDLVWVYEAENAKSCGPCGTFIVRRKEG